MLLVSIGIKAIKTTQIETIVSIEMFPKVRPKFNNFTLYLTGFTHTHTTNINFKKYVYVFIDFNEKKGEGER